MITSKPFRRPYNRSANAANAGTQASTFVAHREDLQPNEAINKRKNTGPPSVVAASRPPARGRPWHGSYPTRGNSNTWRGDYGGRGRGGRAFIPYRPKVAQNHSTNSTEPSSSSWRTKQPHEILGFDPHRRIGDGHANSRGSGFRPSPDTSRTPSPLYWMGRTNGRDPGPSGLTHSIEALSSTHGLSNPPAPMPNFVAAAPVPSSPKETLHSTPTSMPKPLSNLVAAAPIPSSPRKTLHSTPTSMSKPPINSFPMSNNPSPHKRRRIECDTSTVKPSAQPKEEDIMMDSLTYPPTLSWPPQVKAEQRTPSPTPPSRRLVAEACALYPLPDNCRKIHNGIPNSDYMKHRTALITKERAELKAKGLKVTNVLFRDDGMVMEWTSSVPVWSDTLLPESPNPVPENPASPKPLPTPKKRKDPENIFVHGEDECASASSSAPAPTVPTPVAKRPIPMPLPLPKRRLPIPSQAEELSTNELSPPKDKGKAKEVSMPLPRPLALPVPKSRLSSSSVSRASDEREESPDIIEILDHVSKPTEELDIISRAWTAQELEEFEPLAVDYLRRYIAAFDIGFSALRSAYSATASFSCRISSTSPQSTTACQGRPLIKRALSRLSLYKFLPEGTERDVQLHYDVAPLCAEAGGGLLLTVHSEIVAEGHAVMGIDQAFVLQKPTGSGEGIWPLIAISHQMTIRKLPDSGVGNPVSIAEEFPWLA